MAELTVNVNDPKIITAFTTVAKVHGFTEQPSVVTFEGQSIYLEARDGRNPLRSMYVDNRGLIFVKTVDRSGRNGNTLSGAVFDLNASTLSHLVNPDATAQRLPMPMSDIAALKAVGGALLPIVKVSASGSATDCPERDTRTFAKPGRSGAPLPNAP